MLPVLLLVWGVGLLTVELRIRRSLDDLHRAERRATAAGYDPELYELACLTDRLRDTVLTVMHVEGRLVASRSGTVTLTDPEPRHPAETTVIEAFQGTRTLKLDAVRDGVHGHAARERLRQDLVRNGLSQDVTLRIAAADAVRAGRWSPVVILLAGAATTAFALAHGAGAFVPVTAHLVLLVPALAIACRTGPQGDRVTELGHRAIARARAAGRDGDDRLAVAVEGLSALPESHALALALAARRKAEAERRRKAAEERPKNEEPPGRSSDNFGGIGTGGLGCGGCAGCGGGL
ncbi:TIGR04222 domain-containing membrane protein [Kitasatospora sp. NPDC004240]